MRGSANASSSAKADWRGRTGASRPATKGKQVKRVLLSLLALVLVGVLVWLLLPPTFPKVHLACLPIVDYDLTIFPIPFSSENVQQIQDSSPDQTVDLLRDLQTSHSIQTLVKRLRAIVTSPKDSLILYLSGHGVSDAGKAYLLCSDFLRSDDPRATSGGRYELGELLGQIRQCPAKLKLLILDVGHIQTDPRLGMVVNEFAGLLEEQMKNVDDPNLWALTANGPLETSHVSYSMRRSIFNYFVTEGLQGAADRAGDEDGAVELDELFHFVRNGVAQWVKQQSAGTESQTPLLLKAREGAIKYPQKGLFLRRVSQPDDQRQPKPDAAGDETDVPKENADASKEKTDASKQETETPTHQTDALKQETKDPKAATEAAKEGTSAPKEKAEVPTEEVSSVEETDEERQDSARRERTRKEVRKLLEKAWQWRDQMQLRKGPGDWSPVDYAPHLWREYQELLLGYELRYRYGEQLSNEKLAALKDLAEGVALRPGTGDTTVLGRLAKAREQFLESRAKASFDRAFSQAPEEVGLVQQAIKLQNDLVFSAPYYVRWHARAAIGSPPRLPLRLYDTLITLFSEDLPKFVQLLESLEEADPGRSLGHGAAPAVGGEFPIGDLRDQLKKLHAEKETLHDLLVKNVPELIEDANKKGNASRIESLLSTPLLSGDRRMRLLDALVGVDQSPPQSAPTGSAAAVEDSLVPRWQWDRVLEQARLEVLLVSLADPDSAPAIDPSRFQTASRVDGTRRVPTTPGRDQTLWEGYGNIGSGLGEFYQRLPAEINKGLDSNEAEIRRLRRLLRLVDARDVRRTLREEVSSIAVPVIAVGGLAPPRVHVTGPESVQLKRGDWVAFEVTFRATGRWPNKALVSLEYDSSQVEIEARDDKRFDNPTKSEEISLEQGQQTALWFKARPKLGTRSPGSLFVSAKLGDQEDTRQIEFNLSPPDVVDLVVERLVGQPGQTVAYETRASAEGEGQASDTVGVHVFPNRVTEYYLALKNRSGRKRKVTVEFWAVPEPLQSRSSVRERPLDRFGQPLRGFRQLSEPIPVELPADETVTPIRPPEPETSPNEEAVAGPKQPAKRPNENADNRQQPPQPPALEITHGMLCVIRDSANKEPWIRWVDFLPVAPKEYVDPEVGYSLSQRRITIKLKTRGDPRVLPGLSPDAPIEVKWEATGALEPGTEMTTLAKLTAAGDQPQLHAAVEPDATKEIPVRLTVDGYPRAFVYLVRCDRDRQRIKASEDLKEIRITSPADGRAYRVPLESAEFVEFQVDAPSDAFRKAGDLVEVSFASQTQRFYRDRQVEIYLRGLSPQGIATIQTKVGDFRIPFDPGGLRDATREIRAELDLAGDVVARDSVQVILDAAQPRVFVDALGAVPQGQQLEVFVDAEDLSGVKLMEFGFDLDGSGELEEQEKLADLLQPDDQGQWKVKLPTADPKLKPGRPYALVVRATDKVNHTKTQTKWVTIEEPPAKSAAGPATATATIEGRVLLAGTSVRWIDLKVWLEGTGQVAAPQPNGEFSFKEVPPGQYTIHAKGIAGNRFREGSLKVEVKATGKPVRVQIPME